MLEFKVLGALEVLHDGRHCTPTPPKVLRVLAVLLLRANRVVPVETLIEELWGDSPARTAITTTQTYIYQLRKLIGRRSTGSTEEILVTKWPGYLLRVPEGSLDAEVFDRLLARGRAELDEGRPEQAAETLREALAFWTDSPLANVPQGRILAAYASSLEEQRMRAIELRIRADSQLGRHAELIGELRDLVVEHPFNEWLHGQLISALNQVGRRSDALRAYQSVRSTLHKELGLEPSAQLQRLQHEVLVNGQRELAHVPQRQPAGQGAVRRGLPTSHN
ncbi:AfsR/SARP family transcriptional regulator [Microtetraspora fusca]|uniref:BTAD domain-containing putative transcriptional regulator n=1 Tax=Microtetraspora fusca TaxID=1997 RepID=A0ABW6V8P4_MICFU|nr:AfsR/SARP family transcriptional regulator [Microtetraspora fusca]